MKTKFSILLPTRNRSHVVGHAIRSVLGQSVPDLELVISDNSSNDETAKLVRTFADPRIRYFRTERVLGMPDNFENAASKSTGDWITLLPDDCVLSSRCLEISERTLASHPSKVVVWDWWHFYPESAADPARRVQYIRRPFDGAIRYESAHDTLRDLFAMQHGKTLPKPYQSLVHRSLVDTLRTRLGRVFPPPAPDYTFLTAVLAMTDRYTFVDLPLMLSSAGDTTPHASPEAFGRFLAELDEAKKGGWGPIKIPIIHPGTILVESICRVQAELPELAEFRLDLENYLVDFKRQLAIYTEQKYPVEFEWSKYEEFVSRLPLTTRVRVAVRSARDRVRKATRRRAKQLVLKAKLLERFVTYASGSSVVRGEREGFANISEAMVHLERSFANLAPAATGR